MGDIGAALAALLLLAGGLFALGWHTGRRLRPAALRVALLISLAALVLWVLLAADNLRVARLLPVSGILVIADGTLPLAALFTGLLLPQMDAGRRRRQTTGGVLLVVSAAQTVAPVLGHRPVTFVVRPEKGVVLQSTDASCGAASAATLLLAHGIPATEPEMATLCLTRDSGTALLGVYRGLRLKTDGGPWRVGVFTAGSVEELRHLVATQGPVLISVGLDRWSLRAPDTRYSQEGGMDTGAASRRRSLWLPAGRAPGYR